MPSRSRSLVDLNALRALQTGLRHWGPVVAACSLLGLSSSQVVAQTYHSAVSRAQVAQSTPTVPTSTDGQAATESSGAAALSRVRTWLVSSSQKQVHVVDVNPSQDAAKIPASAPQEAAPTTASQTVTPPNSTESFAVADSTSLSLTPEQLACRAAQVWSPARLLLQRAETLEKESKRLLHDAHGVAELKVAFLRQQAAWQQDLVAASALKTASAILAAEEQSKLLDQAEALLRRQQEVQEALIARGVAIADPTAIERKRLALEDQRLVLLDKYQQLRNTLTQLTQLPICNAYQVVGSIEPHPRPLDCDRLAQAALGRRHDLAAWLAVSNHLNRGNAAAAAELISSVAGNVDVTPDADNWLTACLLKLHAGELLERVQRELQTVIQMHRKLVLSGVCERCSTLTLAYERVTVAEKIRDSWKSRLEALQRLEQLGDARPDALLEAQSQMIEAETGLLQRKLEARTAEIDLAESLGGLATRVCCGESWYVE